MKPLLLCGRAAEPGSVHPGDPGPIAVHDKFSGDLIDTCAAASPALFDAAIEGAAGARRAMATLPPEARAEILERAAQRLATMGPSLSALVVAEGGKPLGAARVECDRLVNTFRTSAEAARTLTRAEPVALSPLAGNRRAVVRRVPVGAAGFITPFNFPLNLVAHKVAPAIAAGCPFVLKPASATPLSALAIGEVLAEAGLPEGAFSVLPGRGAAAEGLATDPRLAKLSFTGSDRVGWGLHAKAGRRRVTLELGGNAAVIVDGTADLDDAARRIIAGAFGQAGQSCISVQRVIVTADAFDGLRERLVEGTDAVICGDPRDEATVVGPMIDVGEAERVGGWIREAVDGGARVIAGGGRDRAIHRATLLEGVVHGMKVLDEEVFGPVAVLQRVPDFDGALFEAGRTRFGLQAGVFSGDESRIQKAWDILEVGAVIAGDVPTWRDDAMPYGGVKDSGIGREGPASAILGLTEPRVLVRRT